MNKQYQIVAASAGNAIEETLLYQSLVKLNHDDVDVGLELITSNRKGLAQLYNEKLDQYADVDYLIFCHDDISIEDSQLYQKIEQAIGADSEYSVCGLAGSRECMIGEKNLWHWMYQGFGTDGPLPFSGAVGHYTDSNYLQCFMTNFGPTPQRCVLLDGVFLAINVKELRARNVRFDESYPSKFHFYDIDFCLECNRAGLKMTTWPIWVVHASGGLDSTENSEWKKGNEHFIRKWTAALSGN